jgi:hypothetical protein
VYRARLGAQKKKMLNEYLDHALSFEQMPGKNAIRKLKHSLSSRLPHIESWQQTARRNTASRRQASLKNSAVTG